MLEKIFCVISLVWSLRVGKMNQCLLKQSGGYFWGRYKLERCVMEAYEVLEMFYSSILVKITWVQRKLREKKV